MALDPNKKPSRSRSSQDVWPKWMWVAAPVLIVFIVAGLWWAVFSPLESGERTPTPTPTSRLAEPAVTPTEASLPELLPPTPTLALLPTLPLPTPTEAAPVAPTVAPTTAAPTLAIGAKVVVQGTGASGLNVRTGAGTGHARVKTLPDGAVLEIIGGPKEADGYTWYQVRDEAGSTGWAVVDYMKAQ